MGESTGEGRLEQFAIFLDENHCNNPRLLDVLKASDVHVEKHLDHFAAGTSDIDWLPIVGQNGWCLLTTDKRIRKRPLERQAVYSHGVRMFYFTNNQMSGEMMAAAIRVALPLMRRIVQEQTPPFIASIGKNGDVSLIDF